MSKCQSKCWHLCSLPSYQPSYSSSHVPVKASRSSAEQGFAASRTRSRGFLDICMTSNFLCRVVTSAKPSLRGKRGLLSLRWGEYAVLIRVCRFETGQASAWCVQLMRFFFKVLCGLASPCYLAFHGLLVERRARSLRVGTGLSTFMSLGRQQGGIKLCKPWQLFSTPSLALSHISATVSHLLHLWFMEAELD